MSQISTTLWDKSPFISDFVNLNYTPNVLGCAFLIVPLLFYPLLPTVEIVTEVILLILTAANFFLQVVNFAFSQETKPYNIDFSPWLFELTLFVFTIYLAAAIVMNAPNLRSFDERDRKSIRLEIEGFGECILLGCSVDVFIHAAWFLCQKTSLLNQPIVVQTVTFVTLFGAFLGGLATALRFMADRAMTTVYASVVALMMKAKRWQSVRVDTGNDDDVVEKPSVPKAIYINAAAVCFVALATGLIMVRLILMMNHRSHEVTSRAGDEVHEFITCG